MAVLAWPTVAQQSDGLAIAPARGGIAWVALTSQQQEALQPLAALWPALRPDHQRKWMALARNFHRMSAQEQSTLQDRMTDWARLTPSERIQARLNFGEVRRVPADERRAKWEEYQALPAEQRKRLAQKRPKPPVSAAPALRLMPPDRIVRPPTTAATPASGPVPAPNTLKSMLVPVDRNTLLPLPAVSAPEATH